jgi:RNA polymerase sigma-70 factor (ECF subfamily)
MAAAVAAFEAIDREFRPKLLRFFSGMAGPAEAPDLTQVALLKVSRHLPQFRGDSSLATWIYRIANNVALDRLRQLSSERAVIEPAREEAPGQAEGATAPRVPSAETQAMRSEMNACVREFVGRLPANYRCVVVLSDMEGLSNPEIAQVTGLSLDNVKIRLHRGRARLRQAMQAGCDLHQDERNELACDRRPATSA